MGDGTMMRDENGAPVPDAVSPEDAARIADEDAAALVDEAAEAAAAADLEAERILAEAARIAGGDAAPLVDEAEDAAAAADLEAEAERILAEAARLAGKDAAPLDEAEEAAAAADLEAEADRILAEAARLAGEAPPDPHEAEEVATVDEQALAQAEEERDPEADLTPADIEEPDEETGSLEKLAAKAKRLSEDQARNAIHSLLFVTDKPLAVDQIRSATGLEPNRIRKCLERLAGELREGISGVVLSEVAGGWQLRTAPESAEFVRRFLQIKPRRLTRAALETLAIVAYRQPVTRPEIEDIRGVDCGAVVKALLDWKLLKILGKKDEVGRPLLYGTTKEFLEFFQIKDLGSLPTLREFHELNEESRQIVEEELGPEAAAGIAGTMEELADPAFLEAERERVARSESALADLEKAMADAEQASAEVASGLGGKNAANEDESGEQEAG